MSNMNRRKFLTLLPTGIACTAIAPAVLARGTQLITQEIRDAAEVMNSLPAIKPEPQISKELIRDMVKAMKNHPMEEPYAVYCNSELIGRIEGMRFIESKPEDIQIWKAVKKPYYRQHERY